MLTAEQKLRENITGNPYAEPYFKHGEPGTVYWWGMGGLPPAWVTYHPLGDRIEVRCAGCQNILGSIPANHDLTETAAQMTAIRLLGHEAHKPAEWPQCNIVKK